MNNSRDIFNNNLWHWLDSISIKYKNYEIKNVIIAHKFFQYQHTKSIKSINYFNLRTILSSIKWNLQLKLLKKETSKNHMILKGYCDSIEDLSNKNLYAINFSPNDSRNFLHIAPLAEHDENSLVITVRKDVYNYFYEIKKPVILCNTYNPWINIKSLEINVPKIYSNKEPLQSLDLFSLVLLSRAASLIDLLNRAINESSFPKTLITLQDFYYFDSVFTSYFLGKIPTITLQHGLISAADIFWKYLISDQMIVWSIRQSKILESLGISFQRIKILGTAKYDLYMDKIDNGSKINDSKRVLLGIQQDMFFKKKEKIIFNFIKNLLSSKGNYKVVIRFHPGIEKENRMKFSQKLEKMNLNYVVKIDISDIEDPLEDISKSAIILVSCSGLATEAMLLKKPVIEFLSKKEDSKKFGDYRDFSLHAFKWEDVEVLIIKLLNNNDFYQSIVEKQNNFINYEIMLPPAIPRILNYINSLNNKRTIKNIKLIN